MLTKEEVRKFNSEYISRYAKILSKGKRKEEMEHNHWREISAFETGIRYFKLGEKYKSTDEKHLLKVEGMVEEHSFYGRLDGKKVTLFIYHDDESEFLVYQPKFGSRTPIQFEPHNNESK